MAEYVMETVEEDKREETSKQVYNFYNYRKLYKEFDEDEVEVNDNDTAQDQPTTKRKHEDNDTQDQPTTKRKHEDNDSQAQPNIKRKCEENGIDVDELTKMFESITLY